MTPQPTTRTPSVTRQRATIFHGYGATPEDHWFQWLADQLKAAGVPTLVPALPDPLEPDPQQWEDTVSMALGIPDEHTAVVAHSLGCLTVLRYLGSINEDWQLGTLVLVSGFVDRLPALPDLDSYVGAGYDPAELRSHINRIVIIRSDNDTLVPPHLTDRVAERFGAEVHVVAGAGRFLASDGFSTLPEALEAVCS